MFSIPSSKVSQASVNDVKKALERSEKMVLLDVRTPSEFERGRIENSINLPLQEVGDKIESIIANKNQKIYVYCLSGSRSAIAVGEMIEKGYTNVFNVEGGLLTWRAKHYPTV